MEPSLAHSNPELAGTMLQITQIKPNPSGKDRNRSGATPAQLGGEWIDLKNVGQDPLNLGGISLLHLAYPPGGGQGKWETVVTLTGVLGVGATLRIHAGQVRDPSMLNYEDRVGADIHAFTGSDRYVWNNREGDTPILWVASSSPELDRASYDPNPAEGAVLVRFGMKLVPVGQRIGVRG